MAIGDFLQKTTENYSNRKAIKDNGKWFTYLDLFRGANKISLLLEKFKICKGDIVLLLHTNSTEYIMAYFGILNTGAVVVPVPTDISFERLNYIVKNCNPKVIITQILFNKQINKILEETKLNCYIINTDSKTDKKSNLLINLKNNKKFDNYKLTNVSGDSLAAILYTSGSTGAPKGVCLSHNNFVSNTESICSYLNLSDSDIMMQVLPFYYAYGKSFLNTIIKTGGKIIINNNFTYVNNILKEIEEEKCTGFAGVPSTYHILLNHSNLKKYTFKNLRFVTQAGGYLRESLIKKLKEDLPSHVDIYIMYGQTEATARLSYLAPDKILKKIGSVGKAIPNVKLEIKNKYGQLCGPGEEGILWATGPNIMLGYYKDKEETSKTIVNNSLNTGDLASIDEEGYLYIKGRVKEFLKINGIRVSTRDVENTLLESKMLIDVYIAGELDDLLGEAIIAYVQLKKDLALSNLKQYCKKNMPYYKIPKYFVEVPKIYKKRSGKFDIDKLRAIRNEIIKCS